MPGICWEGQWLLMNNKKYDKDIRSMKNDFRLVVESVLKKMFMVNLDHVASIKRIYVDLNSCLSIMFRYEDIADEELVQIVSDEIETFITKHMEDGLSIYMLYTVKSSLVHKTISPEWCLTRDERVSIIRSEFLKKLFVSLKVFSEKNSSIKMINCGEVHPAIVTLMLDKSNKSGSVILSKDNVFKCIEKPSMNIYNGVEWISIGDNMFNTEIGVFLSNPSELSCYYFIIRGDSRNEYKGVNMYGKIKTVEYLDRNKLKIKADIEHPLKGYIDEHKALFNIEAMISKAKELGLDIDKFKTM